MGEPTLSEALRLINDFRAALISRWNSRSVRGICLLCLEKKHLVRDYHVPDELYRWVSGRDDQLSGKGCCDPDDKGNDEWQYHAFCHDCYSFFSSSIEQLRSGANRIALTLFPSFADRLSNITLPSEDCTEAYFLLLTTFWRIIVSVEPLVPSNKVQPRIAPSVDVFAEKVFLGLRCLLDAWHGKEKGQRSSFNDVHTFFQGYNSYPRPDEPLPKLHIFIDDDRPARTEVGFGKFDRACATISSHKENCFESSQHCFLSNTSSLSENLPAGVFDTRRAYVLHIGSRWFVLCIDPRFCPLKTDSDAEAPKELSPNSKHAYVIPSIHGMSGRKIHDKCEELLALSAIWDHAVSRLREVKTRDEMQAVLSQATKEPFLNDLKMIFPGGNWAQFYHNCLICIRTYSNAGVDMCSRPTYPGILSAQRRISPYAFLNRSGKWESVPHSAGRWLHPSDTTAVLEAVRSLRRTWSVRPSELNHVTSATRRSTTFILSFVADAHAVSVDVQQRCAEAKEALNTKGYVPKETRQLVVSALIKLGKTLANDPYLANDLRNDLYDHETGQLPRLVNQMLSLSDDFLPNKDAKQMSGSVIENPPQPAYGGNSRFAALLQYPDCRIHPDVLDHVKNLQQSLGLMEPPLVELDLKQQEISLLYKAATPQVLSRLEALISGDERYNGVLFVRENDILRDGSLESYPYYMGGPVLEKDDLPAGTFGACVLLVPYEDDFLSEDEEGRESTDIFQSSLEAYANRSNELAPVTEWDEYDENENNEDILVVLTAAHVVRDRGFGHETHLSDVLDFESAVTYENSEVMAVSCILGLPHRFSNMVSFIDYNPVDPKTRLESFQREFMDKPVWKIGSMTGLTEGVLSKYFPNGVGKNNGKPCWGVKWRNNNSHFAANGDCGSVYFVRRGSNAMAIPFAVHITSGKSNSQGCYSIGASLLNASFNFRGKLWVPRFSVTHPQIYDGTMDTAEPNLLHSDEEI